MALCLAHATAGYLVYEAMRPAGPHRPWLLLGAVTLANAPDFDFFPGIALGTPAAYHRGVTHTIAGVMAIAAVVAFGAWLRHAARPWWWGLFAAVAWGSHLVVDAMTIDVVPPEGARFLWPFSDAYLHAPFSLFGEIVIDPHSRTGFVRSLMTPEALLAWGREVAMALFVVGGVQLVRAARGALAMRLEREPEP